MENKLSLGIDELDLDVRTYNANMDKFVFYKSAPKGGGQSTIIRLSAEAYNAIAEIESETGYAISYIASQMVLYATKHTEIKEGNSDE